LYECNKYYDERTPKNAEYHGINTTIAPRKAFTRKTSFNFYDIKINLDDNLSPYVDLSGCMAENVHMIQSLEGYCMTNGKYDPNVTMRIKNTEEMEIKGDYFSGNTWSRNYSYYKNYLAYTH